MATEASTTKPSTGMSSGGKTAYRPGHPSHYTDAGRHSTNATLAPPMLPAQQGAQGTMDDAPSESWLATHTIAPAIRVTRAAETTPRMRYIVAVCGWAALLGVVGLAIGARGFVGVLAGDAAGWYEPTIMITGALGIGATVGGFLSVHRRRVPWILLGTASVALLLGMIFTIIAF